MATMTEPQVKTLIQYRTEDGLAIIELDDPHLRITGGCPRCVMTTLAQGDLPRDPGILRTAAQHNQVNVGVYASVLQGGNVRRGDAVRLE